MTSEILDNIRKRDQYLISYKKTGSKHLYLDYCKLRNLVQRNVKKAKEEYVANKIEETKTLRKNYGNS